MSVDRFALCFVILACLTPVHAATPPFAAPSGDRAKALPVGSLAPDFTAIDAAGKSHKLSEFRGKIVVLDFWATWCGVCKVELPHLVELARDTHAQGVEVVALCVWDSDKKFDRYVSKNPVGPGFTYLRDPAGSAKEKGIFATAYRGESLPSTYVIDREGRITVGVWGWLASDRFVEDALASLGVKLQNRRP